MKKLILALLTVTACLASTLAQDATNNPPSIGTAVSDFTSSTNIAIEPYLTYSPKTKVKIGAGLLAAYNFNNYVGAGLGLDWLGKFSLVSGNVELKLPMTPFAGWGIKDLQVTPFVLAGIGSPISGNNTESISAIYDVGGYISYGHWLGGKFNTGLAWGKWTGAGEYSGDRYHIFIGWCKGF